MATTLAQYKYAMEILLTVKSDLCKRSPRSIMVLEYLLLVHFGGWYVHSQ